MPRGVPKIPDYAYVVQHYNDFDSDRYFTPWIGVVSPLTLKLDFGFKRVGRYTGGYGTGHGGDLLLLKPSQRCVYAYGQRDDFSPFRYYHYGVFYDGVFHPIAEFREDSYLSEYHDNFMSELDNPHCYTVPDFCRFFPWASSYCKNFKNGYGDVHVRFDYNFLSNSYDSGSKCFWNKYIIPLYSYDVGYNNLF